MTRNPPVLGRRYKGTSEQYASTTRLTCQVQNIQEYGPEGAGKCVSFIFHDVRLTVYQGEPAVCLIQAMSMFRYSVLSTEDGRRTEKLTRCRSRYGVGWGKVLSQSSSLVYRISRNREKSGCREGHL